MHENQNLSFIQIEIIDDVMPEHREMFSLLLQSVRSCKSRLGDKTKLDVVIETSDNPHGIFGIFNFTQQMRLENPEKKRKVKVPIARVGGKMNAVKVSYKTIIFTPE